MSRTEGADQNRTGVRPLGTDSAGTIPLQKAYFAVVSRLGESETELVWIETTDRGLPAIKASDGTLIECVEEV